MLQVLRLEFQKFRILEILNFHPYNVVVVVVAYYMLYCVPNITALLLIVLVVVFLSSGCICLLSDIRL